ncbi:MAG: oligopeptide:H+ symporter [Legionella sp.]|jgi:POT family proton-dependent oligopeptide transporter
MVSISQTVKQYMPTLGLRQKQINNIILITFWSQFSVYALYAILILFLTRPLLAHGLGYSQAKAYAFIGVAQAMGYLMPILGGHMADSVIGVRRSILLGSILVASSYLLVMLSAYTVGSVGDTLFIMAYALIPGANSLLMGTSSSMVSHIYADDAIKAKSAMTFYYMAINVGGLLATLVAPALFDSRFGPLSVLTLTFIGKSIAALNFAQRYSIYDSVIWGKDTCVFSKIGKIKLATYLVGIYLLTLLAFSYVYLASILIGIGCGVGILWFLIRTLRLQGAVRSKQLLAIILILEAVVFFIIYNQMNSTLVIFASTNSDCNFFGISIAPAQYQMLNPLLILLIGSQLPRFYRFFPKFTIPYQFAAGTILAGLALLVLTFATFQASNGLVNGNYLALTYILISIAELWVSAIGMSMIGLYCDNQGLAFAMGVWFLASSLSNAISGRLASWVAIPNTVTSAIDSLAYYQSYYALMGVTALTIGLVLFVVAYWMQKIMRRRGIILA